LNAQIEIRRVERDDLSNLQKFWEDHRQNEDSAAWTRTPEQMLHDYFLNPLSRDGSGAQVAWSAENLIGHLGTSDSVAYLNGKPVPATWWQGFYILQQAAQFKADAAVRLVTSVLKKPGAHAMVGVGGSEIQVLKLYERLGFRNYGFVPFLFKIVNGRRVFQQLRMLQRHPATAMIASVASATRIPAKASEIVFMRRFLQRDRCVLEEWNRFPSAVDDLWKRVAPSFDLVFDRSTSYLNWRFEAAQYTRLGVFVEGSLVGVVICRLSAMKSNAHFGNLNVGTLVDFLADPARERDIRNIIHAGSQYLASRGAELIVANASHSRFVQGLKQCGFLKGPSNYQFLTKALDGPENLNQCHITRGDSDGDARL
jgi:hypothetical protein